MIKECEIILWGCFVLPDPDSYREGFPVYRRQARDDVPNTPSRSCPAYS